jgi:hypothetical protein
LGSAKKVSKEQGSRELVAGESEEARNGEAVGRIRIIGAGYWRKGKQLYEETHR